MAQSKKQGMYYHSDDYKKNRQGSENRIKRKKVRDALSSFSSSGIPASELVPTRTLAKRWGRPCNITNKEFNENRRKESGAFLEFLRDLDERKEEMKKMKQDEKWKMLCERRCGKSVRKAEKKLEREGLETPFEDESTDSEVDFEINKFKQQKRDLAQAEKFLLTGSGQSLWFERKSTIK